MNQMLLSLYIGFAIYGVCSLIVDVIVFCIQSLNKKQLGMLGMLWNFIVLSATWYLRPMFPTDVAFYVLCGISCVNVLISLITFALGLMSNEP